MTSDFKVFIDDPIHSDGAALLQEKCDLIFADSFKEEILIQQTHDVDVIIQVRRGMVSKAIMESASRLKVIGKHGVGLDRIDLTAAKKLGIPVVYTPGINSKSVAELFITLALMLAKKMSLGNMSLRAGKWKADPFDFLGMELHGKTLGIMGFGMIGQQTARLCHKGFEMPVLYYDVVDYPEVAKELDAKRVKAMQLFAEADIISINLPLLPQTRGMINAELLKRMKPTSFLINMARGVIWNEADVVKALKEKWIAGAGSDVYEVEPTSPDNPLFRYSNFVGTPHMGGHTEENMSRTSIVLARDIIAVLEGREPKFPVPERAYS